MLDLIDNFLNRITMYRLVLYYLIGLVAVAAILGGMQILPYSPISILVSALILVAACWVTNKAFAALFRAQTNVESDYITALILALIISPISLRPFDVSGFLFLCAAAVCAMASKYILAIHKKHIWNPAALAVALTALLFGQYASWWAGGNLPMLTPILIGGLLVVRKIHRFDLVLPFFAAATASIVLTNLGFDPLATAEAALLHTSMLFFGFVMLTEPLTTPPTRPLRIAYGVLTGAMFSPLLHIGQVYSTPELALVLGNVFAYAVSPKSKYRMRLRSKETEARDIQTLTFQTDRKINFRPGQYMEWTLAHAGPDSRGNRRYFTLASSPTESDIQLGVKLYAPSSSFKRRLAAFRPGDTIMGGALAGDFTLPKDPSQKLVFLAGGIGITPFRSMLKYLSDRGERRDIVLFYSNRSATDIAYRATLEEATQKLKLKILYINTDTGERIDSRFIKKEVPDCAERMFYLSGPRTMIVAFQKTLRNLGIPRQRIRTDFFPGLV
jgi:ferredoxin-NADP reductase/Na+-translocating ferredoxin:NAD+ oxidoreductase RnfD subunit